MTIPDKSNEPTSERVAAAARAGDEEAFAQMTRRYRRELHLHCYRMLASFEEAEDLVQETFLRAWQKRDTFEGRASFRAWLYRIATNACLDFLSKGERRVIDISPRGAGPTEAQVPHVAWLQPYPDRLLERKEKIELAFIVAMQRLPPKQRAALILRDVLEWSASETAELLDSTLPTVNSALQRARATLKRHHASPEEASASVESSEEVRKLVQQYADAVERSDMQALVRLLSDDARFTMPPNPMAFIGNEAIVESWVEGGLGTPPFDDIKCIVTTANGMPAVANYARQQGQPHHEAFALDVLRVENGRIAEVIAFELADLADLVDAFGLPRTLA